MKYILFALLTITLFSCKKADSKPDVTVTATVTGSAGANYIIKLDFSSSITMKASAQVEWHLIDGGGDHSKSYEGDASVTNSSTVSINTNIPYLNGSVIQNAKVTSIVGNGNYNFIYK